MTCFFPSKILFNFGVVWCMLFAVIKSEERGSFLSTCDIERLLKPILSPPGDRTIQAQALRQRLINLIRQGFEEQTDNGIDENSLNNRWNDVPDKRNLQSLAKGGYIKTLPEDETEDGDAGYKRSYQYKGRDDKTQSDQDYENREAKRGIASLARNGELRHSRQDLEDLLEELYEKRNIGSLARDFNFPTYGKRFLGSLARSGDLNRYDYGKRNLASVVRNGKRNLASLVKSNNLPVYDEYKRNIASLARDGGKFVGKRNVAALLRQDNYFNEQNNSDESQPQTEKPEGNNEDESSAANVAKRNLPSIKAGYKPKLNKRSIPYYNDLFALRSSRNKRQADYYDFQTEEFPEPVYQNQNNVDYEDLLRALAAPYSGTEKRFLGSVARSGWPSSLIKYRNPDKRHIGSLARLGWLPSFRSARRFNRSGRSTNYGDCGVCRETTSDGQTEDDPYSEDSEKQDKRFLLIPAVDNILLRKFPMRPRTH